MNVFCIQTVDECQHVDEILQHVGISADQTYTGPQTVLKTGKTLGPYVICSFALRLGNSLMEMDFHSHISSTQMHHMQRVCGE